MQTPLIESLGLKPWSAIDQQSRQMGYYPIVNQREVVAPKCWLTLVAAQTQKVLILCSRLNVADHIQMQLKEMLDRLPEQEAIELLDNKVKSIKSYNEPSVIWG